MHHLNFGVHVYVFMCRECGHHVAQSSEGEGGEGHASEDGSAATQPRAAAAAAATTTTAAATTAGTQRTSSSWTHQQ